MASNFLVKKIPKNLIKLSMHASSYKKGGNNVRQNAQNTMKKELSWESKFTSGGRRAF